MLVLELMPYDDWNVIYLPVDRPTQSAMGGAPLHPLQCVNTIDELMRKQIVQYYDKYSTVRKHFDLPAADAGYEFSMKSIDRFVDFVDRMRSDILDRVAQMRPTVIEMLTNVPPSQQEAREQKAVHDELIFKIAQYVCAVSPGKPTKVLAVGGSLDTKSTSGDSGFQYQIKTDGGFGNLFIFPDFASIWMLNESAPRLKLPMRMIEHDLKAVGKAREVIFRTNATPGAV